MRTQGKQNLVPFDPKIEGNTHRQSGAWKKKKSEVVMVG